MWLGILFGLPQILNYLVDILTALVSLQIIAWGCLILMIGVVIYLRENKDFIYAQLALSEPNQEVDNEPDEDPFDHLIERSNPE